MLSNFCQPHIIQPTRFVDNAKPSLLDNIFLNSIEYETHSENITSEISDHVPNFIILEKLDLTITKATKIHKRDFRKFNPQKFIVDIKHLDLPQILKDHTNANQSYDVFHDLFIKVINKHAPIKTLTKKEIKNQRKPWILEGILKSISKRNNYYSKFLRTKDSLWYHGYKMYRDKINHLIRRSKRNYYRKYFEKFRLNSKKTWTGIKEIINKTRNVSSHINLKINGEMVTDQKRVANKFNEFFTSVAQKLEERMGKSNRTINDYLLNPIKNNISKARRCSRDK